MESDNEFECVAVLHGHTQDVKATHWHPTKEILFSSSYDDTIKIWNDEEDDWYCSHTLTGHTSTVWDFAFNKEGDKLVSCSDDKTIILWDIKQLNETPKQIWTLKDVHKRTIYSVDWSTNNVIATGAADDTIRIILPDNYTETNPTSCVVVELTKAHDTDINCVSWNPKTPNILASCSDDGLIKIWEFVQN